MYESFYKLSGKAFRLSPDPEFFFASRGHKRALAYLRYGLTQAEGFVVITGAPGTGKTTLAQILLRELGHDIIVAHITTTQLNADDMLRMVVASFGLRYESQEKAVMLKTLESYLMARAREQKRVLLVVDEAQNLPSASLEELRMLSNLQVGNQALVQTFLLGQPQFRQKLDSSELEQLRQRVIANYHLSALATDEIQGYIESRMTQVGWTGDPLFRPDAYALIHTHTQGIPRRINVLCDRILLFGSLEEVHEIDARIVGQVINELEQEISGKIIEPAPGEDPLDMVDGDAESEASSVDRPSTAENPAASSSSVVKPGTAKKKSSLEASTDRLILERADNAPAVSHREAPADDDGAETYIDRDAGKGFAIAADPEDESLSLGELPDIGSDEISLKDESPFIGEREIRREFGFSEQIKKPEEEPIPAEVLNEAVLSAISPAGRERITPTLYPSSGDKERFRVIDGGKQAGEPPATASVKGDRHAAGNNNANGDAVNRKILRLVLAYHRAPRNFPAMDEIGQTLPEGITNLLELAAMDDNELQKVRVLSGAGVSSEMFRAAVRFFVRRVFLAPGGDPYRILGLLSTAGQTDIERHYDCLMKLFRREHQPGTVDCVDTIGRAYETLAAQFHGGARTADTRKDAMPPAQDRRETTTPEPIIAIPSSDTDGRFAFAVEPPTPRTADPFKAPPGSKNLLRLIVLGIVLIAVALMAYYYASHGHFDGFFETGTPVSSNAPSAAGDEVASQAGNQADDGRDPGPSSGAAPASADNSASGSSASTSSTVQRQAVDAIPANQDQDADRTNDTESQTADVTEDAPAAAGAAQADARIAALQAEVDKAAAAREAAEARALQEARERALAEANAKAEQEARAKAEQAAEARAAAAAQARAEAELAAQLERESRERAEAEAQARADAEVRARQLAEERGRIEREARLRSERIMEIQDEGAASKGTAGLPPVTPSPPAAVPENQLALAEPSTAAAAAAPELPNVESGELKQLLAQFSSAYQSGDLDTLMNLFDERARTNEEADAVAIREAFQNHFSSTANRQIDLSSVEWDVEQGFARGIGDYSQRYLAEGAPLPTKLSGKVTIQAEKTDGRLLITRFYHTGS